MMSERAREIAEGLRRITEAARFTPEDWEAVMAVLSGCDPAPLARPDPAAGGAVTCPDIDRIRARLEAAIQTAPSPRDVAIAQAGAPFGEQPAAARRADPHRQCRADVAALLEHVDELEACRVDQAEEIGRCHADVEKLEAGVDLGRFAELEELLAATHSIIEQRDIEIAALRERSDALVAVLKRFQVSTAKTPTPVTLHVDGHPFHVKDSSDSDEVEDAIERIAERFINRGETPRSTDQSGPGHVDGLFRRVILEMAAQHEAAAARLRDEVPGAKP